MKINNLKLIISAILISAAFLSLSSCSTSQIGSQVATTNNNLESVRISTSITQQVSIGNSQPIKTTSDYEKYYNYKNNEYSINMTADNNTGTIKKANNVLYYSISGLTGKRNITQSEKKNITKDINLKAAEIIANSTNIPNGQSQYTINKKYTGEEAYTLLKGLLKPLIDQTFSSNNITSEEFSKYLKELDAKITIDLNTKYITSVDLTETLTSDDNGTQTSIINTINSEYSDQNSFKQITIPQN